MNWNEVRAALRKKLMDTIMGDRLPSIGSSVVTKRGGFGSPTAGRRLRVVAHARKGEEAPSETGQYTSTWLGDYIVMSDGVNRYALAFRRWWESVVVEAS